MASTDTTQTCSARQWVKSVGPRRVDEVTIGLERNTSCQYSTAKPVRTVQGDLHKGSRDVPGTTSNFSG